MTANRFHDLPTAIAISAVAFIVADLSHEALGHGLAAYLTGAHEIVLSYTYLSSDLQSRWISSAGPVVNVAEGLLALVLLRWFRPAGAVSFFLFLLINFNLLDAAAYLVYSGTLNSGDLAVAIAGIPQLGLVRIAMAVAGLGLYGVLSWLGARSLRRFAEPRTRLTTVAYLIPMLLNGGAALLNPLGLKYFLLSGLPTTAGANAGLLAMPPIAKGGGEESGGIVVGRSVGWICAALLLAAGFVFAVGPGIVLR